MSNKAEAAFKVAVIVLCVAVASTSAFWAVHRALDGSFWSMTWAFSACVWTLIAIKRVEQF